MKKYLRTIIASIIFLIFVTATILTYTSNEYIKARDKLEYLHSDMGQFSVQVEENSNKLTGKNNDSAYRAWAREVESAEDIVNNKKTLCFILGGFSILSLGGAAVMFVQDRKK